MVRRIFVEKGGFYSREWKSDGVVDDESGESTSEDDVTGVGRGESAYKPGSKSSEV